MRILTALIPFLFLTLHTGNYTFREEQKNYTRVRQAYAQKEKTVNKTLTDHSIERDSLRIYLRAFKAEKKIELWAKNKSDSAFTMVKEIPICEISGNIGPKRRSHDLQAPEGFYHLNGLNPYSKYFLSIQINYPNASDSIRGVRGHLGNQIFIHGSCQSSGCLAITDERIKELYVYCVEAYNAGQEQIDLTMFPTQLTDAKFASLKSRYAKDKDKISLWTDLKRSYDLFSLSHVPPAVKFLPDGKHEIN